MLSNVGVTEKKQCKIWYMSRRHSIFSVGFFFRWCFCCCCCFPFLFEICLRAINMPAVLFCCCCPLRFVPLAFKENKSYSIRSWSSSLWFFVVVVVVFFWLVELNTKAKYNQNGLCIEAASMWQRHTLTSPRSCEHRAQAMGDRQRIVNET